jgi:hypothetical protein
MTMFTELLASAGVEEVCELRGRFGFMAYHGGSLEVATDVIAGEAARRCGASYYGVHQPADLQWHIPSTKVRPEESPVLTEFLEHVDVVVTVHGYGRQGLFTSLLLGGQNRALAEHLGTHLRARVAGVSDRHRVGRDPLRAARPARGQPREPAASRRRAAGAASAGARLEPAVVGLGRTRPRPPHRIAVAALAAAASTWT